MVIDSKNPEDFVEPPRRPRSSRHTRNQSTASQVSLSEDMSSSGDEGDHIDEGSVGPVGSIERSPAAGGRGARGRPEARAHERQISMGTVSAHSMHTSNEASPQSVGFQSPPRGPGHRKSRSSSLTPSQSRLRKSGIAGALLENPMVVQPQAAAGTPPSSKPDQFDHHIHPETGAKMPPGVPLKTSQEQQAAQVRSGISLPQPQTQQPPMSYRAQQPLPQQQSRPFTLAQYPPTSFAGPQSPLQGVGVRPKLKVEIPQDLAGRTGAGAGAGAGGGWHDNATSPSGYLLSSQIVPEPASRLPLGGGEKTPLSAGLPSRYVSDMLPSPVFGADWGVQWSGLPDSAGVRRQGQQSYTGIPSAYVASAGGQTPSMGSMGLPSAMPGLTPTGLGVTARGIIGDAALAMQQATQPFQQQQQQQQLRQQQIQQQQLQLQQQQLQQRQLQQDQLNVQSSSSQAVSRGEGASEAETPPSKRHKPS